MGDYKNTHCNLKSFGNVEIKYISIGDLIYFERLLNEDMSDKDFVIKILFHQFINPQINLQKLKRLSDIEFEELAYAFIKNENDTFKYFQDTGNFFFDFKKALIIGNKKRAEEFKRRIDPIINSTQSSLKSFNNDYMNIIQQSLVGSSFIQESLKGLSAIIKPIIDSQNMITTSLKPLLDQYESISRIIDESLKPKMDIWQKWAEQSKGIFDSYTKYWGDFQKKYSVTEIKAVSILQKYKWFITPSMPITFVYKIIQFDKKKGRHDKEINNIFIQYFEKNNWENLEKMVLYWKGNPIFTKRQKILDDCVKTVKVCSSLKINGANILLPALITQIDGVISDYLEFKGLTWDCEYDDWVNTKTGKVNRVGRKSLLQKNRPVILTTHLDELANDIFLNILFQKSQKGKPLATPFNFNRHKIIHGIIKKYGRKDYLIRAFMVLDLLAHF